MRGRVPVVLLALLLGLSGSTLVFLRGSFASIEGRLTAYGQTLEPKPMPDYSSSWTDVSGIRHTVNTTCGPAESEADCFARHKARVDLAKAAFPPASGPGQ